VEEQGEQEKLISVEKHQTAYINMQFATEIRAQEVTIPRTWIFA
jgi:hypothetical protein